LQKTLFKTAFELSTKVISVPKLILNGKDQASDPESKNELDTALCKAGVKAACKE